MVQWRYPALAIQLEHREINNPQRCPAGPHAPEIMSQLDAQCPHGLVDHLGLVGTEEQDVAVTGINPVQQCLHDRLRHELQDGRLQAGDSVGPLIDLDPSQPLGSVDTDKPCVIVNFLAAQMPATRPSASFAGPLNTLKSTSCIRSAISVSSRSMRRSGLSLP